jgi:hypothetical protein
MYLIYAAVAATLIGSASAHFQLAFPAPRGPFVEPQEIGFCGPLLA